MDGEVFAKVDVSFGAVILDKMHGPTGASKLRIRVSVENGVEWVIEREWRDGWLEWCRIPGQLDADYEGRWLPCGCAVYPEPGSNCPDHPLITQGLS